MMNGNIRKKIDIKDAPASFFILQTCQFRKTSYQVGIKAF